MRDNANSLHLSPLRPLRLQKCPSLLAAHAPSFARRSSSSLMGRFSSCVVSSATGAFTLAAVGSLFVPDEVVSQVLDMGGLGSPMDGRGLFSGEAHRLKNT